MFMKILVINWRDIKNPLAGGAEVYFQEIFKRIAAAGHNVHLLCVKFPGAPESEMIDNIQVRRIGGANTFNFAVYRQLKDIVEQENYDIVIDDLNKIPFFSPWNIKKPVLVMMMHLFRGSIFKEVFFPFGVYVYLSESFIPLCYKNQIFVALSESSKKDLLKFGIDAQKIVVVPPGTDTVKFHPDFSQKGEKLIVHVGRLKRYKSADHLIMAAKLLTQKRKDFKVMILGDGDDVPRLKELNTKLGLDDIVQFTGFIPESEKVLVYQKAALLVENSVKEGWGLIVMEANACGTPVVASKVPGLVDSVIENKTGFFYEYGNIEELAQKIERLLDDAPLRNEIGKNGIEWANQLTWDKTAGMMLDAIKRATEVKS
jgi:glycosyltransferase involved in cell wall biosynthesis